MASFVPSYTATQLFATPTTLRIVDTTTINAGVTITSRKVYLLQSDGTYLVPEGTTTDYIVWSGVGTTLNIEDVLSQDFALEITVQWIIDNVGVAQEYEEVALHCFAVNSEIFDFNLSLDMAQNRNLINNDNFMENKNILRVEIDSAYDAISDFQGIYASQQCLNSAKYLIDNPNLFA